MAIIEQFLLDLKVNDNAQKFLNNLLQLDEMVTEVATLRTAAAKDQVGYFTLKDKDYTYFKVENGIFSWKSVVGTVLSSFPFSDTVSSAKTLTKYGDKIYFCRNYNPVTIYSSVGWVRLGYFGIRMNGDYSGDFYSQGEHICIGGGSNEFAAMSHGMDNRVSLFNNSVIPQTKTWGFGDGSEGVPADGKLASPNSTAFLPNGNVLICCASGRIDPSYEAGYISEHVLATGVLVKIHLDGRYKGVPSAGGIHSPQAVKMVQKPDTTWELWACSPDDDVIMVYAYDEGANTFTFSRIIEFTYNNNTDMDDWRPRCFYVDAAYEKIYVPSDLGKIVVFSAISGAYISSIGVKAKEGYRYNNETIAGTTEVTGLLQNGTDLVILDEQNQRIQQFPIALVDAEEIEIEYEGTLPVFNGTPFYTSDSRFNTTTLKLKDYPKNFLNTFPPSAIAVCGKVCT